eukprot:COSAG02_NODE_1412_length_12756_cov_57.891048_8_plen_178_part_00
MLSFSGQSSQVGPNTIHGTVLLPEVGPRCYYTGYPPENHAFWESCTPTHHRTHDFPSCTTPTHHRTHAKSAKNTVPIATPTITPSLHPLYTRVTPTLHPWSISECPKNVCKIVCEAEMYADLYVIQLTVLLLNFSTPAEHPNLHPHPRNPPTPTPTPMQFRKKNEITKLFESNFQDE